MASRLESMATPFATIRAKPSAMLESEGKRGSLSPLVAANMVLFIGVFVCRTKEKGPWCGFV